MSVNILIYEHLSAGGMEGPVPLALADAGDAMRRALVEDFAAAGGKVWTVIGNREDVQIDGQAMARITSQVAVQSLVETLAPKCEVAIIVAPETDGILEAWVQKCLSLKLLVINCPPKAIALCADKLQLWRHLDKHGVASVPTKGGDGAALIAGVAAALDAQGGAYIIKPRDGAGCESTYCCRTAADAQALSGRITGTGWIAQPFIEGTAVSMSFIAHDAVIRPLLAGMQTIEGDTQLHYAGGRIPLPRPLADRAAWLGTQAVRSLGPLRGFIGVDLVLGDDARQDMVIEINPRITVSYCGLRELCTTSLARAMIDENAPILWRRGTVAFDHAGAIHKDDK